MKTLGIVGGIGPESTIEYYRFILDGWRGAVRQTFLSDFRAAVMIVLNERR